MITGIEQSQKNHSARLLDALLAGATYSQRHSKHTPLLASLPRQVDNWTVEP